MYESTRIIREKRNKIEHGGTVEQSKACHAFNPHLPVEIRKTTLSRAHLRRTREEHGNRAIRFYETAAFKVTIPCQFVGYTQRAVNGGN